MMRNNIIGREKELHILDDICNEKEARLVAVYGRRRVGKTYLVKNYFGDKLDFFFTGSMGMATATQLALFSQELNKRSTLTHEKPKNWFEAFNQLKDYLLSLNKEITTVFLDELPWLDTPKSNFLQAFSYFWNSWASTHDGLKVVICGSATSWMLDNVIGDKGGLYGRTSRSIYLSPFTLGEVEEYLKVKKGIEWNRYQILEAYMIFGGIPYYLDMLEKEKPFAMNVDELFFAQRAPLKTEYDFLFRSLFGSSEAYKRVVEVLAHKSKGLTLVELKKALGMNDGGTLSKILSNLCGCDFIRKYAPFGKKTRGGIYQLTDLYSLFFRNFLGGKTGLDEHYWSNLNESARNAWAGLAFEQVCLHHISQIKGKLSIKGVLTNVCSWQSPRHVDKDGTEWAGAQIDLLLCRADNVIDVCEMKYCKNFYSVTKNYEEHIRTRNNTFAQLTKTKDAIHNVLVTTYGLTRNLYSGIFNNTVTMDDLFQ